MAENTAFRNNALPYPVYGVPWTVVFALLDADGDPVTGATCDSEVSINGETGADCTNEGTEITFTTATNKGQYYLTLTAAEMTGDIITVSIYSATSKATVVVLYPRKLVTLAAGTSQGGAAGYITLAASTVAFDDQYNGCLCVATIDTLVEARILMDCTASNQQCTVTPSWNVTPDADDTYIIYLPEGMHVQKADVTAIKTQTVTCGAAVTIRADIGAATIVPTLTQFEARTLAAADYTIVSDLGTVQSGDSYPLVSTEVSEIYAAVITNAAGVDIAADIIAVKADTTAILTDTGTTLDGKADQIIAAVITNAAGTDIAADIIALKTVADTIATDTTTDIPALIDALPTAAEIVTQIGTGATLTALATATNLGTAITQATEANTHAHAIDLVTAKLDTALVADGLVSQFTANALELAPTGSAPTADQIAAKILATPANLLATDTAGRVTVKNRSI